MRRTTLIIRSASMATLMVSIFALSSFSDVNIKLGEVVKEMSIKGDFRLRHETIYRPNKQGDTVANASVETRHRQRMRLRLGIDFKLPQNLEVKTRLATGINDQVSSNQSFDNLSNQKNFALDRAFVKWQPLDQIGLFGGKMENPFWNAYSDDLVWDGDLNPEGFAEKFQTFGPMKTKWFLNALQMIVDEDSAGTQDQMLFSQQLGVEILVLDQSKLTLAGGLHEWVNERNNNFSQSSTAYPDKSTQLEGNRRVSSSNPTLLNEFRVAQYTGQFDTTLFAWPVAFIGTYIHNQKAMPVTQNDDADKGFQYGTIVGKAGKAKTWEVAYFYKRVEMDATVADISDSDFGNGGTNRKGHIMWGAYSPTDFLTFIGKYFNTKTLNRDLGTIGSSEDKPINRYQLDMLVKF